MGTLKCKSTLIAAESVKLDSTVQRQVQAQCNTAVEVQTSFVHQRAHLQHMSAPVIIQMRAIQMTRRLRNTCALRVSIAQGTDYATNAKQEDMGHHLGSLMKHVTENVNQVMHANQEAPRRFKLPAAMQQFIVQKPRVFPFLSTRDTIQHLKFIPSLPIMLGPIQHTIFNVSAKLGTGAKMGLNSIVLKERMGLRLDQQTLTNVAPAKKVSTVKVSLPHQLQSKRRLSVVMRPNIAPEDQPNRAMLILATTH